MRDPSGRPRPALLLALIAGSIGPIAARAQSAADDRPPLARYIAKDNLTMLIECDGVDAHADAWKKTATYKVLNDTTTGAMFEELLGQTASKLPQLAGRISGPDAQAIARQMARAGFLAAFYGDASQGKSPSILIVFRDAFKNKDVRPAFARALGALNSPGKKPESLSKAGHKVISGRNSGGAFAWWIEETKKEDLFLAFMPTSTDPLIPILETLDGKHPTAVDHPGRVALIAAEANFTPVIRGFANPEVVRGNKNFEKLGLASMTRLDFRWGFQDDALLTIARIAAPRPHEKALSLLDGPSFDRSAMPAIPETTNYSAASINVRDVFDKVLALAKAENPALQGQLDKAAEGLKAKSKLKIREDFLAHLGPRAAWYILPAKAGSPPTLAAPTMASMALAMAGIDGIPKAALVIDIDNPIAVGKALDELMAYANREIKSATAAIPGMAGGGGEAPAPGGPGRGGRNRGGGGPSVEFRSMPGEGKSYVLSVSQELASMIPAAIRPTIRVGPKQMVVAISPEVARLAMEAKAPPAPPAELASAYAALPPKLKFLSMADPRDALPALLASYPEKLQARINAELIRAKVPAATPADATKPAAGAPATATAGTVGSSGTMEPGVRPGPGTRRGGGSGEPASPAAPAAAVPPALASIAYQIDPGKLPSAESIRPLLFPTLTAMQEEGDGFRITIREAFPDLGDPSKTNPLVQLLTGGGPPGMPGMPGMPPTGMPPGMRSAPAPGSPPMAVQPGAQPGAPGQATTKGGKATGGNAPMRPD